MYAWNTELEATIKSLPETNVMLATKGTLVRNHDVQLAAIDNGPIVTKDGVRRGNNSLAMRSIGRVSRHNAQRPNMVSHSKILVDKASQKKEKALAIPEQVGRMIAKCLELETNIAKKLSKGHDAMALVKCLERTQAQVRYMLDHCEAKGLLEIQPMKTGKAKGSLKAA